MFFSYSNHVWSMIFSQITKHIHAPATGSKGELQKSHGPCWADEVLAISGIFASSEPHQAPMYLSCVRPSYMLTSADLDRLAVLMSQTPQQPADA